MTLNEIRVEIDGASERRRELWRLLSEGHDATIAAELKELDERLSKLWNEERGLRARMRFGAPEDIIRRARLEERLERAA